MIFDARTLKERDVLGYYPNSIPVELNTNIPKHTWILVYSGDNRAANAAEALHKLGYINVRYITESYNKLMPGY
jgi:rhodanese-related sulfurtransferase